MKNEFILKPLPYESSALDPIISTATIDTHYKKHHGAYVTNLNNLLSKTQKDASVILSEDDEEPDDHQQVIEEVEEAISGCKTQEERLREIIRMTSSYVDANELKIKRISPDGGGFLDGMFGASEHKREIYNKVFNNASQVYNHDFYWRSMIPGGGNNGFKRFCELVKGRFDCEDGKNFEEILLEKFKFAATDQFGSGWAWLVLNRTTGNVEILKTSNAHTPIETEKLQPLITIDVWEHAYYIDRQNRRPEYIKEFFDNVINWDFATKNLEWLDNDSNTDLDLEFSA